MPDSSPGGPHIPRSEAWEHLSHACAIVLFILWLLQAIGVVE